MNRSIYAREAGNLFSAVFFFFLPFALRRSASFLSRRGQSETINGARRRDRESRRIKPSPHPPTPPLVLLLKFICPYKYLSALATSNFIKCKYLRRKRIEWEKSRNALKTACVRAASACTREQRCVGFFV